MLQPAEPARRLDFRHPQFDLAAVAAQQRLPGIQGRRGVWFAGAWCGYGFHEDGLTAGIAAARGLGVTTPFDAMADPAPHPSPALQEAAA